jgi:hypothetical protein
VATPLSMGVEGPVSLLTTVNELTGISTAKWLVIWESDVELYVVTGSSDGASLPSTGRRKVPTAILPFAIEIGGYGFVGLAGASAGTARVEARS